METRTARPTATSSAAPTLTQHLLQLSDSRRPWLTFHAGRHTTRLGGAAALDLAARWATAFVEAGVTPGARVLLMLPNGADFVGAFFGAHLARAIPVPVAWPFFPEPPDRRVASLGPVISVCAPAAIATSAHYAAGPWPCAAVCAPAPRAAAARDADPVQPAFLQFTSGTTGPGRGAVISQAAAVHNAASIGHALGVGPDDVGVSWLPLFHDMGLVGALLTSLVHGFELHVMRPGDFLLRPERWVKLMSETGATLTVAPNFAYDLAARKVARPEAYDLSALRHALNGSEPVHRATLDRFAAHFAQSGLQESVLRPVYGLAENTLAVAFDLETGPDLPWHDRAVPTVGPPLPGTEVMICDPRGRRFEDGVEGEITLRSPSLMSGYFGAPEETARALLDGWLRTGDLGVMREGRLYVTGRAKELIFKGGEKFYPYEIERVLADDEAVPPGGVAAFAVPAEEGGGDLLVVALELKSRDQGDAERRVRGRLVEALGLRPDRVAILTPGALPRTTSGKVRRTACRSLVERA